MKTKKKGSSRKDAPSPTLAVTSYFRVGDLVLMGKYKNALGQIVAFGEDKWGNPTVEIEPVPKGRKKNRIIGLFRIWRSDIRDLAAKKS